MNTILAIALLATSALATPLSLHPVSDTTNVTIHTRQTGTDSGISISTYTKADCKGDGLNGEELFYNTQVAQQFRSYSLSDDIGSDQTLAIFADSAWKASGSKAVDTSLNGNTAAACTQSVYNLVGNDATQGCHTLPNVVGCLEMQVSST